MKRTGVRVIRVKDYADEMVRIAPGFDHVFDISAAGVRTKRNLFDLVKANLPLNPELGDGNSWDAMWDSLFEGIYEMEVPRVLLGVTDLTELRRWRREDFKRFVNTLVWTRKTLRKPTGLGQRRVELLVLLGR